ncbi:hypothetical protein AB0M58_39440 [Streptomyces bobili]|uniref:hypothetical protein n=1 Tax=Streptomyces bobili TaxID=67280 RepID=UPI00343FA10D
MEWLISVLVCLLLVGLATHTAWSAVLVWRDPRRAQEEARQWDRLGKHGAWAVTRGLVAMAASFACLALMMITYLAAEVFGQLRDSLVAVSGVFLCAMLACWLVILMIALINRPRCLIPPHLRAQRRP